MGIRTDINGVEVGVGDVVHCFDGKLGEETASMRGVVNMRFGHAYVGDNAFAISNAENIEVLEKSNAQ